MIVGRIATIVVVMGIGVVVRIHDNVMWTSGTPTARRRRRQHRTITVIVVTVFTGTVIVTRTRSDVDDHPRLIAIAIPAEAYGLEVFESGEAIELVVQFVVGHHRVKHGGIWTVGRDGDCNPSDAACADLHVF